MKQTIKRIFVALLLLSILASVMLIPASAATAYAGERFNIMLVIDGSGSLETHTTTDPNRMRYELLEDLMGILEDDGHNIGAIVFSGNYGSDTSPEAMASCVLGDTYDMGILSLDERAPDGRPAKDYIMDKIRSAGYDRRTNGFTDIGTALLLAERKLQELSGNGRQSLVFLFTDGLTDFTRPEVLAQSQENLNTATYEMSQSGIRLFGAFLNQGGRLDSTEMRNIVCAANGVGPNSMEFAQSYVEITDAATCHQAVDTLLAFLGYIQTEGYDIIFTEEMRETFTIPGIGVEEMNIRLYSVMGETLPDLHVEITQPDGTVLTGVTLDNLCRSSRTIRTYKLVKPMPGEWQIYVKAPKGNQIKCKYSPVVSLSIDANIASQPDAANIHANMAADFIATLSQYGNVVTDPAAYRGYDCTLEIKDATNSQTTSYPIAINGNGQLISNLFLDFYGTYQARTVFTCGKISVASPYIDLDLENHIPTASAISRDLTYGLFQDESTAVDLTQYINDVEDGTDLTVTLKSATCAEGSFSLSGTQLTLMNETVGDGTIYLTVTDSQGASVELPVYVTAKNVTIWYILAMVAVLILIIVIVLIIVNGRNRHRPTGELIVEFACPYGNKDVDVSLDLDVPGKRGESKTTLQKLMSKALRSASGSSISGVPSENIMAYLGELSEELKKVTVSADIKRTERAINGKKVHGAIRVKSGKVNKVLFNSAQNISLGEAMVTLSYYNGDEEMDPFSDSPIPDRGKNDPADDLFSDF